MLQERDPPMWSDLPAARNSMRLCRSALRKGYEAVKRSDFAVPPGEKAAASHPTQGAARVGMGNALRSNDVGASLRCSLSASPPIPPPNRNPERGEFRRFPPPRFRGRGRRARG